MLSRFFALLAVNWRLGPVMMGVWTLLDLLRALQAAALLIAPKVAVGALRAGKPFAAFAWVGGSAAFALALLLFDRLSFMAQHYHQERMNLDFLRDHLSRFARVYLAETAKEGYFDAYQLTVDQCAQVYMNVQWVFRRLVQLVGSTLVGGGLLLWAGVPLALLALAGAGLRLLLAATEASLEFAYQQQLRPARRRMTYLTALLARPALRRDLKMPGRARLLWELVDASAAEQVNCWRLARGLRNLSALQALLAGAEPLAALVILTLRTFAGLLRPEDFFTALGAYRTLSGALDDWAGLFSTLKKNDLNVAELESLYRRYRLDDRPALDTLRQLDFENVSFGYGGASPLLRDLSFSLNEGEKVLLLGPNGCGKTTVLALARGLYLPQSGAVRYNDGPTSAQVNAAALFASAAQTDGLYPFTYGENITLGRPDEPGRLEGLLTFWGLPFDPRPRWGQSPAADFSARGHSVSTGQAQSVNLLRSLWQEGQWLLLDEPTEGLDDRSAEAFWRALKEKRVTALVVSHDRRAEDAADRTVRLSCPVPASAQRADGADK